MKKKLLSMVSTEEDLLVDVTFHDLPATLFKEFAEHVVRQYYSGNLSVAVKDLMQKAVAEQEFVHNHMKT